MEARIPSEGRENKLEPFPGRVRVFDSVTVQFESDCALLHAETMYEGVAAKFLKTKDGINTTHELVVSQCFESSVAAIADKKDSVISAAEERKMSLARSANLMTTPPMTCTKATRSIL